MTKYGARRTEVDGIVFASKAEARRYGELRLMERAGDIRELMLQPSYALNVNGTTVGRYVADFAYIDNEAGQPIVEDVKGVKTPAYRLKKKLVKAIYGIEIVEIAV